MGLNVNKRFAYLFSYLLICDCSRTMVANSTYNLTSEKTNFTNKSYREFASKVSDTSVEATKTMALNESANNSSFEQQSPGKTRGKAVTDNDRNAAAKANAQSLTNEEEGATSTNQSATESQVTEVRLPFSGLISPLSGILKNSPIKHSVDSVTSLIARVLNEEKIDKQKHFHLSSLGEQGKLAWIKLNTTLEGKQDTARCLQNCALKHETVDLMDCMMEKSHINLTVVNTALVLNNSKENGTLERCCNGRCTVRIHMPGGEKMSVRFLKLLRGACLSINVQINVKSDPSGKSNLDMCKQFLKNEYINPYVNTEYIVQGSEIEIVVTALKFSVDMTILLSFYMRSGMSTVEGFYVTKYAGYIQSPVYDGHTNQFLIIHSWIKVDIPTDHQIMISFLPLDMPVSSTVCTAAKILVFTGNESNLTCVESVCSIFRPKPRLYDTENLFVHYNTYKLIKRTLGFRVLFTLHNASARPEKVSHDLWNCSVDFWPDFQRHFPCNLQRDCADGRDEIDCPYTHEDCGAGRFKVAETCFMFIAQTRDSEQLSWNEANRKCQLQGARLASLSSPKKWNEVLSVLKFHDHQIVYIGLRSTSDNLPPIYRFTFHHLDGTVAYFTGDMFSFTTYVAFPSCFFYSRQTECALCGTLSWSGWSCTQERYGSALCEFPVESSLDLWRNTRTNIIFNGTNVQPYWDTKPNYLQCPSGHVTHDFMACDPKASCWARDYQDSSCSAPLWPLPPLFECSGGQRIPYMLVCDHQAHCNDDRDEDFCFFSPCDLRTQFQCDSGQCILGKLQCDNVFHCADRSDEVQCVRAHIYHKMDEVYPPARVDFNKLGRLTLQPLKNYSDCPETHFQCPGDGYCLPAFLHCNGVYDCPDHEDERGCESFVCPGFYRCRGSRVCLHFEHVCDDVYHCPQRDDELACFPRCSEKCTCYGTAFFCSEKFFAGRYPELRYLDASDSGITFEDLVNNTMLIHLNLRRCNLTAIVRTALVNLQTLDLTENRLTGISVKNISEFHNLQQLYISKNPFSSGIIQDLSSQPYLTRLRVLEMSLISMKQADFSSWHIFSSVTYLNLSNNDIDRVTEEGFQSMKNLHILDLGGNPMTYFPADIFQGLQFLEALAADNYKLCCPSMLPSSFEPANCRAPSDEISSCQDLLQSNIYRGFLSLFAFLSLVGNCVTFAFRMTYNRSRLKSFHIFVTNLSMSDFLMGVYLSIIGLADLSYRGRYLWTDEIWRNSFTCKAAGFLSLLSNEVSAIIISLITLDRFLVLHFPFSERLFTKCSSFFATTVAWGIGVVIAGIPLLPWTSDWKFYSQNGICIPLPITRKDFPGNDYAFSIIIVFNFVLFLMIACGQLLIYWTVKKNSICSDSKSASNKEFTVARRLIAVALSDFICWCPLGVLGFMASAGTPISGEVNVAIAVFVLPVNSAINPFLYTMNVILENRRNKRNERVKQMIASQVRTQSANTLLDLNRIQALKLIKYLASRGVLLKKDFTNLDSDDISYEETSETCTSLEERKDTTHKPDF